ncbi:MAG: TIGR00341 family protein [Anaerolineae bacterium]|nr:TIGR00341 family protein [Anaerolineae bacterium]
MAIVNPSLNHIDTTETLKISHPIRTTIIPVANPDSAPPLLQIAETMGVEPGGHIVLLYVVTDDHEVNELKIAAFRTTVEEAGKKDHRFTFEVITHHAVTVVDGIIEIAYRYRAEKILLGLSYSIRGQVELGQVVETVAERAPCDVVVYRNPIQSNVERIVVPVGGSIASRVILQLGIRLAQGSGLPVEALHVYSNGPEWEARSHVESLLADIPGHELVTVNVIHGVKVADSVLSWSNENDMMVVGFSERSLLEKWLYGDTAQRILDRAMGPVLVVSRAIDDAEIQALARRRLSWLRPLLTQTEQEHIIWHSKDTVLPTLDYFVLLIVAALLASLGLLLNSSAVVIGAMLVAPLMSPIIALGVGLCTARLNLMRKAFVTIGLSVLMVLAVGMIVGILIPPTSASKEMLARAYPSLLDAGVALGSGFIGAYATARKDIPAALAGVAIAAALVPPICTVGLSIVIGEPRLALGAALLFITNMVCITVIGAVVFFWMGMRPTRLENHQRRRRYSVLLAGLLAVVLLVGALLNFSQHPSVEKISESRLQAVFDPAELIGLQITKQDPLMVVATVRTSSELPSESVKMAQVMLSEDLDTPVRLRVVVQKVIDGMVG